MLVQKSKERILVIFIFVSQGDPQLLQFVGNFKISPSKSSKVKLSSDVDRKTPEFSFDEIYSYN